MNAHSATVPAGNGVNHLLLLLLWDPALNEIRRA